jgi:hypothetical protein
MHSSFFEMKKIGHSYMENGYFHPESNELTKTTASLNTSTPEDYLALSFVLFAGVTACLSIRSMD